MWFRAGLVKSTVVIAHQLCSWWSTWVWGGEVGSHLLSCGSAELKIPILIFKFFFSFTNVVSSVGE